MPVLNRARRAVESVPAPTIQIQGQRPYTPGSSFWARFRPVTAFIVKYTHKIFGDKTPVTRLVDRTVRALSDLSPSQKHRLQSWVDAAKTPQDKENRTKIANAILECARTSRRTLDLSNNNVDSLPDVLGELRQLKVLLVGGNNLKTLPDSLSGLRNLSYFACDKCGLVELPSWLSCFSGLNYLNANNNNLSELPRSFEHLTGLTAVKLTNNLFAYPPRQLLALGRYDICKVFLSGNPIPAQEREAWNDVRGSGELLVYCTPRVLPRDAEGATLDQLLDHWFVVANQDLPREVLGAVQDLEDIDKETLRIHLYKLVGTLDYEHPVRGADMAKRVAHVLQTMAADPDVMTDCLNASREATSSCTDRALLGLNNMEQAVLLAGVRREDDPASLVKLGAGFWRLKLVEEIADQEYQRQTGFKRVAMGHERDQVEVVLAYKLGLRDQLNLPLAANQHMLDRRYSEVTDRMLQEAGRSIEQELAAHPEREYRYLANWEPLREKLADLYYGDVDDINETYQDKFAELGDLPLADPAVTELKRAWEEEVEGFYMRVIKNIKQGTPLPYHRKDDVLKKQQEEFARLRTAARNSYRRD